VCKSRHFSKTPSLRRPPIWPQPPPNWETKQTRTGRDEMPFPPIENLYWHVYSRTTPVKDIIPSISDRQSAPLVRARSKAGGFPQDRPRRGPGPVVWIEYRGRFRPLCPSKQTLFSRRSNGEKWLDPGLPASGRARGVSGVQPTIVPQGQLST